MPSVIALVDLLAKIAAAPQTPIGTSLVGPVEAESGATFLRVFPFPNSPRTFLRVATSSIVGDFVELDPSERAVLGFAGRDTYRFTVQAGSDIDLCVTMKLMSGSVQEQIEQLYLSLGDELELGEIDIAGGTGVDKCPARA